MEAYHAGQRIFGENKIQDMVEKHEEMPKDIQWHMIGHVQRNKVKYMAAFVSLIHGVENFKTLKELLDSDERYGEFEAFKKGNVYTYMNRVNDKGANDYFESGNVNPDRLLADHIKIMHPELLPDYELYYYLKLK